jgi:thymidylate synthase ThyX
MYSKSIDIYGDGIGHVDYVNHMGDDLTVVNSARVSFGVEKEELDARDRRLINYLIKHKHTSTLEHNLITFRFCVPMYVRSQHHRHRTWSYNEISRRYTDVNIKFYEPEAFRTQHKSNRQASNAEELIDPDLFLADPEHTRLRLPKHSEDTIKFLWNCSTALSKQAFAENKPVEFYHRTSTPNTTAQSICLTS